MPANWYGGGAEVPGSQPNTWVIKSGNLVEWTYNSKTGCWTGDVDYSNWSWSPSGGWKHTTQNTPSGPQPNISQIILAATMAAAKAYNAALDSGTLSTFSPQTAYNNFVSQYPFLNAAQKQEILTIFFSYLTNSPPPRSGMTLPSKDELKTNAVASYSKPTNTGNQLQNVMNGLINHFSSLADAVPLSSLSAASDLKQNYLPVSYTTSFVLKTFSGGCMAAKSQRTIALPGAKLSVMRGAVVAFAYSNHGIAILNLHDNRAGDVALTMGSRKVVLQPGHELVFAEGNSQNVGKLQPISKLALRRTNLLGSIDGLKLFDCEFSIPSCAKELDSVRTILASKDRDNIKVANRILKTAVILNTVTGGHGPFVVPR